MNHLLQYPQRRTYGGHAGSARLQHGRGMKGCVTSPGCRRSPSEDSKGSDRQSEGANRSLWRQRSPRECHSCKCLRRKARRQHETIAPASAPSESAPSRAFSQFSLGRDNAPVRPRENGNGYALNRANPGEPPGQKSSAPSLSAKNALLVTRFPAQTVPPGVPAMQTGQIAASPRTPGRSVTKGAGMYTSTSTLMLPAGNVYCVICARLTNVTGKSCFQNLNRRGRCGSCCFPTQPRSISWCPSYPFTPCL